MAILKIASMGNPILRRRADEVADPSAPEVRRLIHDMLETMQDAGGTGLAAPQVYAPLRIVVFFVAREQASEPPEEQEGAQEGGTAAAGGLSVPLTVLINPVLEPLGEEMDLGPEACLSVPGLVGQVPRYRHLRYRALTPSGDELVREAKGFHARVVQHECDHLDGILYPQRMTDLSTLAFMDELHRSVSS
ncbi:MAG: peptide deformylase [Pseudomonadota bacterium]